MATYQDLVAQKKELEAHIEAARKAELATAVAEVKRLVGEYGLSPRIADLARRQRRRSTECRSSTAGRTVNPGQGAGKRRHGFSLMNRPAARANRCWQTDMTTRMHAEIAEKLDQVADEMRAASDVIH